MDMQRTNILTSVLRSSRFASAYLAPLFVAMLLSFSVLVDQAVAESKPESEPLPENYTVRPPRPKPKITSTMPLPRRLPATTAAQTAVPAATTSAPISPVAPPRVAISKPVAVSESIDAILLLDASGSMQKSNAGELQNQSAKLFARFLTADDRLAIISFDSTSRQVLGFTEVAPENLGKIDDAINAIPLTGTHTDFESPMRMAFDLLLANGREGARKVVTLLSDGKFDPHPQRGDNGQLRSQLLDFDLPLLSRKGARVYTVSLNDDTDKPLMDKMAQLANGEHWVAKEINVAHRSFSELFLEVRRPGAVPLHDGFSVTETDREVTFYITRASVSESVGLIDPRGDIITNTKIPPGVRWFKDDTFDIVTIDNPLLGVWGLDKRRAPSASAMLLDNIKFEVKPIQAVSVGDSNVLAARFTNNDKPILLDGFRKSSYVSYKIIKSDSPHKSIEGLMAEDGAAKSSPGVYSAPVTIGEAGSYQVTISAIAPTFTRSASFVMKASSNMVLLSEMKVHDAKQASLVATLSEKARLLHDTKLVVRFAKEGGETKTVTVSVDSEALYPIATNDFPGGKYTVKAFLEGKSQDGTAVTSESDAIVVELVEPVVEKPVAVAEVHTEKVEEHEKPKKPAVKSEIIVPEEPSMLPELASVALTLFWVVGMFLFVKKRYGIQELEAAPLPEPWELPGHIQRQIAALKAKASTEKRELLEDELLLFSGLPLKSGSHSEVESREEAEAEQSIESQAAEHEDQEQADSVAQPEVEGAMAQTAADENGDESAAEATVEEITAQVEAQAPEPVVAEQTAEPVVEAVSEPVAQPVVEEAVAAEDLQADIDAMIAAQQSDEVVATVDTSPGAFVEKAILEELAAIDRLIEELNAQG